MTRHFSRFRCQADKAWHLIEKALGLLCALILVTMMMLTTTDVIARYVFNKPIQGAYEMTELLMASLAFLALPLVTHAQEHIEVQLLDPSAHPSLGFVSKALYLATGLFVFGAMSVKLWDYAGQMHKYGRVTNALDIPVFYAGYLACVCCVLSAAILAVQFFKRF